MEESLIKPNQFRKCEIQIFDEPTDPHKNMGIDSSEDPLTPTKMERSTYRIVTHPTTDNKIHEC